MFRQQHLGSFLLVAMLALAVLARAQDYDDEGYGNQGANAGGNGNQGDNDGYQNSYNDDGYSGNAPSNGYQQNVDPEGSNSSPSSYSQQGGSDADGDYEGDDGSAAASSPEPSVVRVRRSTGSLEAPVSAPKLRVKRHGKYYIGPVYTYVKTDKHANFKWGVKHKVGKKYHG